MSSNNQCVIERMRSACAVDDIAIWLCQCSCVGAASTAVMATLSYKVVLKLV
jgi:hypothetical protein